MAAPVVTYSAVAAKLRAMYGGLLALEDYALLMNKQRVDDVFSWLIENSAYSKILSSINGNTVHRGQMERMFNQALFRDASGISSMLPKNDKRMLEAVLMKRDIQTVKRVIRSIHTGISLNFSTADIFSDQEAAVLQSRTYGELAVSLQNTPLHKVIRPFLTDNAASPFAAENALDQYYFTMLMKSTDRYLRGQARKTTKAVLAEEADIRNLLRSYRYRRYYACSGEQMLARLVPNRYQLNPGFWKELADSDSKDFRRLVMQTKYKKIFVSQDDADWYREASQTMADQFKKHFREQPYTFTAVLAYLFFQKTDIQNVIAIIEGVRYSLEPRDIRRYLITVKTKGSTREV